MAGAGVRFDDRMIAIQLDELAALDEPKEPHVIHAGEGLPAIAAEQVERSPTEPRGALAPAVIEEPATVIEKPEPPPGRDIGRQLSRIEPRHGPYTRRFAVVLDNSSTLIKPLCPAVRGRSGGLFKLFNLFKR